MSVNEKISLCSLRSLSYFCVSVLHLRKSVITLCLSFHPANVPWQPTLIFFCQHLNTCCISSLSLSLPFVSFCCYSVCQPESLIFSQNEWKPFILTLVKTPVMHLRSWLIQQLCKWHCCIKFVDKKTLSANESQTSQTASIYMRLIH